MKWVAYGLFLVSVVWAVFFLAGGIDIGAQRGTIETLIVDVGLLGLFAVQHTVMARPAVKRHLSAASERSLFVLSASLILIVLFWQWRPLPATVWRVEGPLSYLLWALYAAGWVIAFASTFMIDHLELFGLRRRQVEFKERWLYAWVRHPMMLGLLIAFWATPRMSVGHLLFAGLSTGYIFIGTLAFEERDLRRSLGQSYADYARRVPAFLPLPKRS